MTGRIATGLAGLLPAGAATAQTSSGAAGDRRFATYANAVDLPCRHQPSLAPYPEGADSTMVRFRGRYWLFVPHSKGY